MAKKENQNGEAAARIVELEQKLADAAKQLADQKTRTANAEARTAELEARVEEFETYDPTRQLMAVGAEALAAVAEKNFPMTVQALGLVNAQVKAFAHASRNKLLNRAANKITIAGGLLKEFAEKVGFAEAVAEDDAPETGD